MPRVGPKVIQAETPKPQAAGPAPTWASRIGPGQFKKEGLAPVDLATLPKTQAVREVLDLAGKNPNPGWSPLNERPPLALSAFRDAKSGQLGVLVWEPADFMGTLHVFNPAGDALGKLQIND